MTEDYAKFMKRSGTALTRRFDAYARQFDLTAMQLMIIDFLSNNADRELTQHDVELEFGIQRSTTTVLIQRMEKRGLVSRATSKADARRKILTLLPATKPLSAAAAEYINGKQEAVIAEFTAAELATFKRVANFIANNG